MPKKNRNLTITRIKRQSSTKHPTTKMHLASFLLATLATTARCQQSNASSSSTTTTISPSFNNPFLQFSSGVKFLSPSDDDNAATVKCPDNKTKIRFDQLCDGVRDCSASNNGDDETFCDSDDNDNAFSGAFAPTHDGNLFGAASRCICLAKYLPNTPSSYSCRQDDNLFSFTSSCKFCETDPEVLTSGNCVTTDGRRWNDLNLASSDVSFLQALWEKGFWNQTHLMSYDRDISKGRTRCIGNFFNCGSKGQWMKTSSTLYWVPSHVCARTSEECARHHVKLCKASGEQWVHCKEGENKGCIDKSIYCEKCLGLSQSYYCQEKDACVNLQSPCGEECPKGYWSCFEGACLESSLECVLSDWKSLWKYFPEKKFSVELEESSQIRFGITLKTKRVVRIVTVDFRINGETTLEVILDRSGGTLMLKQFQGFQTEFVKKVEPEEEASLEVIAFHDASTGLIRVSVPQFETFLSIKSTGIIDMVRSESQLEVAELTEIELRRDLKEMQFDSGWPGDLSESISARSGRELESCEEPKRFHYCDQIRVCLNRDFPCQNSTHGTWSPHKTKSVLDLRLDKLNFDPNFLTIKALGPNGEVRLYDTFSDVFARVSFMTDGDTVKAWSDADVNGTVVNIPDTKRKDATFGIGFAKFENKTLAYFAYDGNVAKLGEFLDFASWYKVETSAFGQIFSVSAEGIKFEEITTKQEKLQNEKTILASLISVVAMLSVAAVALIVHIFYRRRQRLADRVKRDGKNSRTMIRRNVSTGTGFYDNYQNEELSTAVEDTVSYEEIEMKEFKVYNEYYGRDEDHGDVPDDDEGEEEEEEEEEDDVNPYVFEIKEENSFYNEEEEIQNENQ